MRIHKIAIVVGFTLAPLVASPGGIARAADQPDRPRSDRSKQRDHWENVILFYGDEETGEWSLRIQDRDVHDRAWFEWKELWQFDPKENAWQQLKTEQFAKAIVLPKQKGSDEPADNQTLVKLEEIPVKTAGLWYAKWRVDAVDGGTMMRVGTNRTTNHVQTETPPPGMIKMAVPISLEKSVGMMIPDPRIYCVTGGPGKPEAKPAKPEEKPDAKKSE